ncbi:hypothetical protein JXB02_02285 [Candidatus Woesearchaeota archaeon]|nr:hypothetical protein [Candidatus Woesearchaeota archaeon]
MMVDISKECYLLMDLREARSMLDRYATASASVDERIRAADTKDELASIERELVPYVAILSRFKRTPVYHNLLSSRFGPVKRSVALLKGRLGGTKGACRSGPVTASRRPELSGVTIDDLLDDGRGDEGAIDEGQGEEKTPQTARVDLDLLLRYYKQKGVVGEEKNLVLATFAALNRQHFGIEGPSGSGKTFIVEPLIALIEDEVYRMELAARTAETYNTDEINAKRIIYVPELQKAVKGSGFLVTEMLKNLTEGKDFVRRVKSPRDDTVTAYRIGAGKGVIYTLAFENDFKKDVELSRRVFQLYTDISKEHNQRVIDYISDSQCRGLGGEEGLTPAEEAALYAHAQEVLAFGPEGFINPFARYLGALVPPENKAKSFISYYYDLMGSSAKFFHQDRTMSGGSVLVDLQDAYTVHTLYGKQFLMSILKVPMLGEGIMERLNGTADALSPDDIYAYLRTDRTGITKTLVKETMEELADVGYLERVGPRRESQYRKGESLQAFDSKVDWQACWDAAKEVILERAPDLYEPWAGHQTEGGALLLVHPLKGTVTAVKP